MDRGRFRAVLGSFPTGVCVVTTLDGSRPRGITVSSFASLSLDPPLVGVVLDRTRTLHAVLCLTRRFAVNILGEDQQALSDCFAGAAVTPGRDAFCGATWSPGATGLPVLDGAIASLEADVEAIVPVGDHDLFVGRVTAAASDDRHPDPLLYYRRRYLKIERATTAAVEGLQDGPTVSTKRRTERPAAHHNLERP